MCIFRIFHLHLTITSASRIDQTLSTLFWATFGMGNTKAAEIDERYLGLDSVLITTHSQHHSLTVIVGYLLFWSYTVGSVVLISMLIALMSNSFQEIYVSRYMAVYMCVSTPITIPNVLVV